MRDSSHSGSSSAHSPLFLHSCARRRVRCSSVGRVLLRVCSIHLSSFESTPTNIEGSTSRSMISSLFFALTVPICNYSNLQPYKTWANGQVQNCSKVMTITFYCFQSSGRCCTSTAQYARTEKNLAYQIGYFALSFMKERLGEGVFVYALPLCQLYIILGRFKITIASKSICQMHIVTLLQVEHFGHYHKTDNYKYIFYSK